MIKFNNQNQALKINLASMLMTIDEDRKKAIYAGIAYYMLSVNKIDARGMLIDNPQGIFNENTVITGLCRNIVTTLTYDLNAISVIDRELFQDIMIRFIKAKNKYMNGRIIFGEEINSLKQIESPDVYYSIYKEAINKEFNAFKNVYSILDSLGVEFSN